MRCVGSTARGARLRDRVEHHAPLGLVVQHDVHVGATQHDGEGHAATDQQPARAVGVDAQHEPDLTLANVLTQGLSVRQGVDVQQGAVRCRYALREPCRGDGVPSALTKRREDEHARAAQLSALDARHRLGRTNLAPGGAPSRSRGGGQGGVNQPEGLCNMRVTLHV